MNEIGLIRRQLATEQTHALEVIAACAVAARDDAHLVDLRHAAREYLARVLGSFARRDERLGALAGRMAPGDTRRRALDAALARAGASEDALVLLEEESWQQLAEYLHGVWSGRCAALDTALGADTPVTEWREISAFDADAVLEERTRYSRVRAAVASQERT
jgi:hypothetical protein